MLLAQHGSILPFVIAGLVPAIPLPGAVPY